MRARTFFLEWVDDEMAGLWDFLGRMGFEKENEERSVCVCAVWFVG